MEKQNNFKIFEFENQLLARKHYDDEEDNDTIVFTVIIEGNELSATIGYDETEKRDKIFESDLLDEVAKEMHDSFVSLLAGKE